MGDSRISYTIILKDSHQSAENKIRKSLSLSADSTLSEVISHISSDVEEGASSSARKYTFGRSATKDGDGSIESIESANISNEIISLSIYDCTTYPPKDITTSVNQYTNTVGPKSITLQRLGWFPSGKLYICQCDDEQTISSILNSNIHSVEDFEYNNPTLLGENGDDEKGCSKTPRVLLTGDLASKAAAATGINAGTATKPLPSQLFKAVQSRFDDDNDGGMNGNTKETNDNNQKKKRRTEAERRVLLDRRLEELDQKVNKSKSKKNKKVSDQVKKMLIKSRAAGNKKVLQCDRFYLNVVLWDDTYTNSASSNGNDCDDALEDVNKDVEQFLSSSYMFHSRVASIGRVISSAVGSKADARNKGAELLVLTSPSPPPSSSDGSSMVYRRLPPTLPLHEAESKGYFCNFGRVVVRIFQAEEGSSISNCYTQSIDS